MKNTNAHLVTNDSVTVVYNGTAHTAPRDAAERNGVLVAIKAQDFAKAARLLDKATAVTERSAGAFVVRNGIVYHNGVQVNNVVAQRILEFSDADLPFMPLVKFLELLLQNPSSRAVAEGYEFLEHKNLPVTEDGHFLAYKSLASNYFSKASGSEPVEVSTDGGKTWKTFTGRIPNFVGSLVRMTRNLVDDNREHECSHGLHVGALGYSGPKGWYHSAGDKIVIVKVNPKDIVSVPKDHDAQKLRVSGYEVVSDFKAAFEQPLTSASGNDFDGDREPEVECLDCYWSGLYSELRKGRFCPDCDSDATDSIE